MPTTASARTAGSSLLGTVTSTANMLTTTVSTLSDSVDILHSYVARHKTMQVDKTAVELALYKERLERDSAKEITDAEEEIEKYLHNNPQRTERFNAAIKRVRAALNPEPASA